METSADPTGGTATWTFGFVQKTGALEAMSCPSNVLCVGVDDEGNVVEVIMGEEQTLDDIVEEEIVPAKARTDIVRGMFFCLAVVTASMESF